MAELVRASISWRFSIHAQGRGFESGRYLFQLKIDLSDWSILIELNTLGQERACAELVCSAHAHKPRLFGLEREVDVLGGRRTYVWGGEEEFPLSLSLHAASCPYTHAPAKLSLFRVSK